jgi:hypothetical protein
MAYASKPKQFEDNALRDLTALLEQIHAGKTALPDFQRNFVWDPPMTQELIVSIAYGIFAGSVLRIPNTQRVFAWREFQGAPALNGCQPASLVLDGQQRLTSLYQAFYGVGKHLYYVDLRRLLEGADFEDCLFHLRANPRQARAYEAFDLQARKLILPLSILKDGLGGFRDWSRQVVRTRSKDEERDTLEDALNKVEERWMWPIVAYQFPVVTLSETTSADFAVDPYYILQIISLATSSPPVCMRKNVLNMQASTIAAWRDRAVESFAKGLEILRDDCSVIAPKCLPYNPIVMPLAAILAKSTRPSSPMTGTMRDKLIRWFWCAVFRQTYKQGSNTQAARDVVELLAWCTGGEPPESVRGFQFDPRVLREAATRQSALYCGTMCLILSRGPRGLPDPTPHNLRGPEARRAAPVAPAP